MKIGFLTSGDPRDRHYWSGTPFHMARALQKHVGEVTFLGPANLRRKILGQAANRMTQWLFGKKYDYTHSIWMAKGFARFFRRKLFGLNMDVIVAPAASTEIAFLEHKIPILYVSDVTFALMQNYQPGFSSLLQRSAQEANKIERWAIQNSTLLLYSSGWAARSAVVDYGADPSKVTTVPFGANLDDPPARETVLKRTKPEICRLFFVGKDWEGKGGPVAFETLLKLEERGLPAELVVCGCVPPTEWVHPKMTVIPFLRKGEPAEWSKMSGLFVSSSFFLLPTRFDCTPIVFCEAAAFGLPVIATDTGGVSGVVAEGKNGHLLPPEATGEAYARLIAEIYRDDARYHALMHSSRQAFEERLNWDTWANTVKKLLFEKLGLG